MSSYMHELIRPSDRLSVRFEVPVTAQYTFPAHWHKYIEILYILSGRMSAVVQGEEYRLSAGDILVVNSEDIHMTKTFGDETEYILLQIPSEQLERCFPDFCRLRFQTMIPKHCQSFREPGQILLDMLIIYREKEDGYPLLFSARLYELLYCLYRGYSKWCEKGVQEPENKTCLRIARMTDWIYEHYRESISLDEAAAHVGYSREYFCRIFKKCTGQTFFEYVQEVRAMKLHEELCDTDESITGLMEKHGITNYKVFLNTFRKLYGDTPRGLRQKRQ